MRRRLRSLAALLLALAAGGAAAVESDPLPVPAQTARAAAVKAYNEGVALLVARRWAEAQAQFQAALERDDSLAEAHNNLAYSLRMQGPQNFEASRRHYDRALQLQPRLAQAWQYRGMLFVLQGDLPRARADLARLRPLDARMAAELERAIECAGTDSRNGIAPQFDY